MPLWKFEKFSIVFVLILVLVFFTAPQIATAHADSGFDHSNFAIKYDKEYSGTFPRLKSHNSAILVDNDYSIYKSVSSQQSVSTMHYFSHLNLRSQFSLIDFSNLKDWKVVGTGSICHTDSGVSSIKFSIKVDGQSKEFQYTLHGCNILYSHAAMQDFLNTFFGYLDMLTQQANHSNAVRDSNYEQLVANIILIDILIVILIRTSGPRIRQYYEDRFKE